MANWTKNLLALLLGLAAALGLAEWVARQFVPMGERVVWEPYRSVSFRQSKTDRLPQQIAWQANSLGLRGPELPADSHVVRILCVGGSTTECTFLNDGQTWPDHLQLELTRAGHAVWVGNAGRDGLSTFGQLELLPELLQAVKPQVVLLLNGVNDLGRSSPNAEDRDLTLDPTLSHDPLGQTARYLAQHSALARAAVLAWRRLTANDSYARRHELDFDFGRVSTHPVNYGAAEDSLRAHLPYIRGYRARMDSLKAMCRQAGAVPIVLTQPLACGSGLNFWTGTNLENLAVTPHHNGFIYASLVQSYTLSACGKRLQGLPADIIEHIRRTDLGHLLKPIGELDNEYCIETDGVNLSPKAFYDVMHFTPEGAQMFAQRMAHSVGEVVALVKPNGPARLAAQQKFDGDQQQ